MRLRLLAAIIFALFGALTVVAMVGPRLGKLDAQLFSLASPIAYAALSAGFCGAVAGNFFAEFRRIGAMTFGAFLMLLAQIPFGIALAVVTAVDSSKNAEFLQIAHVALLVIIMGWFVAGLYQIATGAIAGLILYYLVGKAVTPPVIKDHDIW